MVRPLFPCEEIFGSAGGAEESNGFVWGSGGERRARHVASHARTRRPRSKVGLTTILAGEVLN
jgi:hypothetical protein